MTQGQNKIIKKDKETKSKILSQFATSYSGNDLTTISDHILRELVENVNKKKHA